MKRLSIALFAAGVLIALAAVAAACGGDGDDSDKEAQEYFEQIVEIFGQHGAGVRIAQAAYDATLSEDKSEKEQVRAFLLVLEMSAKSIRAEIADREEIDPPPETEKAHLDLLTAARVMAKVYEDALEEASDAKTSSQLQQALVAVDYGTRLEEAKALAEQACSEYQALADEAGVEAEVC